MIRRPAGATGNTFPKLNHQPLLQATTSYRGDRYLWDSSASPAENEKDHAHHQEQKEQNFRDSGRRCGNAAESKYGCYQGNY
jgi:hypothetical protein